MATLKITGSGNQNGCYVAVGGSTGTKLYTATSTRVNEGTTLYFYASGSQNWIGRVITLNGTIVGTSAYSATYYSHTVTGDIEVVFTNEGSYYSIAITTASDPGGDSGGDSGGSSASEHKTKVNGTAYQLESGTARVNGVAHDIESGRALVDGTAMEIEFAPKTTTIEILGSPDRTYAYVMVDGVKLAFTGTETIYVGSEITVYVSVQASVSVGNAYCTITCDGVTVKRANPASYTFTAPETPVSITFTKSGMSLVYRYDADITTF